VCRVGCMRERFSRSFTLTKKPRGADTHARMRTRSAAHYAVDGLCACTADVRNFRSPLPRLAATVPLHYLALAFAVRATTRRSRTRRKRADTVAGLSEKPR